jgi:branched-chain amino acid transport system substrate-binding protein
VHRSGRVVTTSAASARLAALASVIALIGSACTTDGDPLPAAPDRPPVQVDDALGVLRVPAGQPLRIAMVLDVTGDDEGLAGELESAFRAALEDFGPVQQGFRAVLEDVRDAGCAEDPARAIGEQLALDAGLAAVLGPQCSASLLGLQEPVSTAGLLLVTPRPMDVAFTSGPTGAPGEARAGGVWRTAPSLLDEARAAATYARLALELERAATFHDGTYESATLVTAFKDRFESLGGTVVIARTVDVSIGADDADDDGAAVAELLDAVAAAGPDVAYAPLPAAQLLALADDWDSRTRLRSVARITSSRAATPDLLGDPASEGYRFVAPLLRFPDAMSAVTGMSSAQVVERVTSLSGVREPQGWWAHAYDAATLLLRALEDASLIDVDGSLVVSRSELRDVIARLTFDGLTGTVACDALGDCSSRRFVVHAHDDAARSELASLPVEWSTDEVD